MIPHLLTRKRKFSEEARSIPKKLKTVLCSESETSEQVSVPLVTGVSSNRREQALDCVLPNVVEIASDEKQRSACSTFDIVEHCNNVEKSGSFSSSNFMKGTLIDGSKARIIKEKIELSILANESKDIGKILAHTDPSIEVNSTTDLSTTRLDHDRSQKNCYCDESKQEVDRLLPRCYAPTLKEFLLPSGVEKYLPRPEWYSFPLKQVSKLAGQFATEKGTSKKLESKDSCCEGEDTFPVVLDQKNANVVDSRHQTSKFGRYQDSAIHVAIRRNASDAMVCLLEYCCDKSILNLRNGNGETPLMLACVTGNVKVVTELLREGADPKLSSIGGDTACLIACQHGHAPVLELLLLSPNKDTVTRRTMAVNQIQIMDETDNNQTTALIIASREGHVNVVKLLLRQYLKASYECSETPSNPVHLLTKLAMARDHVASYVNKKNRESLIKATQNGHIEICKLLIEYGSANDDYFMEASANEVNDGGCLLLACEHEHVDVVRMIVASGYELFLTNTRGQTAYDVMSAKLYSQRDANEATNTNPSNNRRMESIREIMTLIDPVVQVALMKKLVSRLRNYEILGHWHLLQSQRALVFIDDEHSVPIHSIEDVFSCTHVSVYRYGLPSHLRSKSQQALIRTMTLPLSVVQYIIRYMSAPPIWNRWLRVVTKRCFINPVAAVSGILDLIDEVLEEGGFIEACDMAGDILPPSSSRFNSWKDWKACRHNEQSSNIDSRAVEPHQEISLNASIPSRSLTSSDNYALATEINAQRMAGCYMQQLAYRSKSLQSVLSHVPFNMATGVIQELITLSDIASVVRRLGVHTRSVYFEPKMAMDFVMLATRLVSWLYGRQHDQDV